MRISIIGLGVIGGSLGLALKSANPRITVIGFDKPGTMRGAKKRGAIDIAASGLREAVVEADLVFVCTPVNIILDLLPKIARYAKKDSIITDVGSVKGAVDSAARRYFRSGPIFVGGHPMAGSEGSGIGYADPLLFQNAVYVLCPLRKQTRRIDRLASLLKMIGARVLIMDARRHDETAAAVSHLPQLLAVALMEYAAGANRKNPALFQLAAGGFRDMTRIASSPYPIWHDIIANNRRSIGTTLGAFEALLRGMKKELSEASLGKTGARFRRAKSFRDSIPRNTKGFLHSLHDVFVSVEDTPGVLANITAILFSADINISDIELLKVREGERGTFRLSFDSEEAATAAARALRAKGIRVAK